MKKNELITEFATKANITKKEAADLLNVLQEVVYTNIGTEGGVKLFDGVTLARSWAKERSCKNPQTGETMIVPAHYKPVAKFGKLAKTVVND